MLRDAKAVAAIAFGELGAGPAGPAWHRGSDGPVTTGDHDRVAMVSRRPDGTPDQAGDFEYMGPRGAVLAGAKVQLSQQRVSALDVAIRGVQRPVPGPASGVPDAAMAETVAAHKAATEGAEADAEAEVNSHHIGEARRPRAGGTDVVSTTSGAGGEVIATGHMHAVPDPEPEVIVIHPPFPQVDIG